MLPECSKIHKGVGAEEEGRYATNIKNECLNIKYVYSFVCLKICNVSALFRGERQLKLC